MTCRTVPMSPSLCTCGVVLDITVFHGDDDIGNDLCPTCSGCGCEPNERKNMNEQELEALPEGAVVLDRDGGPRAPWQKVDGRWVSHAAEGSATSRILRHAGLTLLHPAPEPDHSMCARLVPQDSRTHEWVLIHPNGNRFYGYTADEVRSHGYAIPEPEPTVVERAAEILSVQDTYVSTPLDVAQALADAGLLVRDGEQ